VVEELNTEILAHFTNIFPSKVARTNTAPHVLGKAVDWTVAGLEEKKINALALQCGLTRPVSGERWHFQLANQPPPVSLLAQGHSPINILVTDPRGRRVGYDPGSALVLNEIGLAASYSGPGTEPQAIAIEPDEVLLGAYRISGIGTGAGFYTLTLSVTREDDVDVTFEQILAQGMAVAGQPLAQVAPFDIRAGLLQISAWPAGRDLQLVAPGWLTNLLVEHTTTLAPPAWEPLSQSLDNHNSLVFTNLDGTAHFFRVRGL
jgi:hypothetical protein